MSPLRKKVYRIVAAYLLLNMTAELLFPVAAHALTNGPGQPEFQSFEPAGSTEMVNLFTGDFSYNIPLMTVPGPNGGYPINLAYHAGIGMEQEASWVGLGWNINAGAINRSVRGLPDDFKGDQVTKKLNFRPSNSAILNFGTSIGDTKIKKEIFGFNQLWYSGGVQAYYNNYSGIGFQFAGNFALGTAGHNGSSYSAPLKINLTSSSDGIGVNVKYSILDKVLKDRETPVRGAGVSIGWGSREGISSFQLSFERRGPKMLLMSSTGAGVSFVTNGFVPHSTPPMTGFIANTGIALGPESGATWVGKKTISVLASYNRTKVKDVSQVYKSYGYNFSQYSTTGSEDNILEDINREKDNAPSRQSKTIGVPIATYDMYNVTAQGMGGTFRPYRSDIGIYTDPGSRSEIYGGTASGEFGTAGSKWGFDGAYVETKSYSGMWDSYLNNNGADEGWEEISNYEFQDASSATSAYEPFYFKMAGELTSAPITQLDFMGSTSPVRFSLRETFEDGGGIAPRPEIASDVLTTGSSNYDLSSANALRTSREKTVTRNGYRSNEEMQRFTATVPENIYATGNNFPALNSSVTSSAYAYTTGEGHHTAEFTETGADGSRYVYGLPVYNKMTKEVMFAEDDNLPYPSELIEAYSTTDASENNDEVNTDQLFSCTEMPPYVTEYLLTAVYSPDYVDVTGDGPTEGDLGYYTKFNYVLVNNNFKWRMPYGGAFKDAGFLSNVHDDKLSYQYGEKEIYLLHSIETKTHVACFFLGSDGRKDGHEAWQEEAYSPNPGGVSSFDELFALDSILLFSKSDPGFGTSDATPIKAVHFTYDYSLCNGVDNNENTTTNTGKLTLKEIYFTYKNNHKGKLSPYKFTYSEDPDYDIRGNDRWGTYKPQPTSSNYLNNENPYTDQRNRANADQYAAAWALSAIELPSGSVVNVEYEADDYAYVQDKRAMQMCRVVGFCDESITNPSIAAIGEDINKHRTRLVFELSEPILYSAGDKQAQVFQYLEGIEEMYFKMFMALKLPYVYSESTPFMYDYVDGFCKLTNDYGVINDASNDHQYAYVTVDLIDRDDYPNLPGAQVHPIQKAAWQHIYLERPDLFAEPDIASGTIANLVTAATAIISELPRAVAPYVSAQVKGWGNAMDIDPNTLECNIRPSYVRLNAPTWKKIGGGHRVKEILITDSWDAISTQAGVDGNYGQSYSYVLADGKSSGVASYEPMVGGEENAMCLPIRYNSQNLVKKDAAFYVMEPIGESYYPAPIVGYSRVIVTSIVDDPNAYDANPSTDPEVTKSRTGKTEYGFYTAKDYPVFTDRTDLQKTWFPVPVIIPFAGTISYNNRGFSQGFVVELNDMHGKLKSVSTYPSYVDLQTSSTMPTRRVFYKYNGGYDANSVNHLDNTVTALTGDGRYESVHLGETYDFFIDTRQYGNRTQELGAQLNMTGSVFTFMPTINISKSLFRSVATMKVIYRTGILTEVETMDDGARSTARNLMFDAETGAPLLTVVENEFERPVYTYNFAAHWAYEGMQGAYKNQGVRFGSETTDGSGMLVVTDAENYFYPGDEVMYIPDAVGAGTMLWVKSVDDINDEVELIEADGTSAAGYSLGTFIIHRSGRRNLQSVSNGVIVSLSNPVADRSFPLFEAFNACTTQITGSPQTITEFYTDCATGELRDVTFSWNATIGSLIMTVPGESCEAAVTFPAGHGIDDLAEAFTWDLQYAGGTVTATKAGTTLNCQWSDGNGCFKACLDNVLHASAVRFAENWSSTATEVDAEEINFSDVGVTPTANEYKYGLRGVWRTHSNYLYQVDRKQTTASVSKTDISKDGTYDNFVLYNWEIAAQDNTQWAFVSAVTRYSPYGYALETRDALGIYSSVMYGYSNTKQTSAAANCQYFEMAFDGFEDYAASYTGHGHMLFVDQSATYPTGIDALYSHTGKYSYAVQNGGDAQLSISTGATYGPTQQYLQCQPGQEYFFSVWARSDDGGTPAVIVNTGTPVTYTPDLSKSAIDGWRKIDVRFTAPTSGSFTIKLSCQTTGQANFDDIRIQPFKSAMTSYVYDPQTHWLLAELDNRNYATFYNYDEEGALVQVKQETEKGIFTVQTSRGNIIRQ